MHSWRALLLPYLDGALAKQYDFSEPWDGPHNRRLITQMPDALRCPSDKDAPPGTTNYAAVVGDLTAWPYDASITLEDFHDGLSNTVVIVEVSGLNIPWTCPRDLDFDLLDFVVGSDYGVKSNHKGGTVVLLGDGSTAYLPTTYQPDALRSLLTKDGGESVRLP